MKRVPRDQYTLCLSPANQAVVEVAPGEELLVECPSAYGGVLDATGAPSTPSPQANPMAGPVRVRGVLPGEHIALRIGRIEPVGFGIAQQVVYAPQDGGLAFLGGVSVPAEPSIGCIGVAPRLELDATTNDTCGPHGGNLDCRDVAEGAWVFFRARVPGGNLGFGDVHLAMGDGELGGQGIEAAADAVIQVFRGQPAGVEWPYLVRNGWIMTLGGDGDFRVAQSIAYEEMVALTRNLFNLERSEVQARIAAAGQLKVCQACCALITVRVCLPLELLGENQERFIGRMVERVDACPPQSGTPARPESGRL